MSDSFVPSETGQWVSDNFSRLAEIIRDYDSQFELRWIPPEQRMNLIDKAKCYVIWDTVVNSAVLFANEFDQPQEVLGRLFDSDNKHGDVLKRVEAHNAAKEAFKLKEELDWREDARERVAWLMKTDKNYIQMGNGRVVDDQLREVRRERG